MPRLDTTNRGGDFYLATSGTSSWPPAGTFSWPRTVLRPLCGDCCNPSSAFSATLLRCPRGYLATTCCSEADVNSGCALMSAAVASERLRLPRPGWRGYGLPCCSRISVAPGPGHRSDFASAGVTRDRHLRRGIPVPHWQRVRGPAELDAKHAQLLGRLERRQRRERLCNSDRLGAWNRFDAG